MTRQSAFTDLEFLDESGQGQPFDLYFLNAAVNVGPVNGLPNITAANARAILAGPFAVGSSDYRDFGACRVARSEFQPHMLRATVGTTSAFVAGVSRGTGTYAAAGLRFKLGFLH